MASKTELAEDINRALKRVGSKAYAEVRDNKINYVRMGKSSFGEYPMKVSRSELMGKEMHGEDIRALRKKWGMK